MTQPAPTGRGTTRRAVVTAAGAAGLAATLAACGKDDDGGSDSGSAGSARDAGSAQPSRSAQGGGSAPPSQGGGDGMELAKTSQIPEGGGMVFKDHKVVVTQPTAGEFKAFSAICTHAGCSVGDVSGGTINCPCHQSKFDITDGSVKGGPARKPLPGAQITVRGSSIRMV
ncbi:Rieske (2Fe-2S) protein [Streptomyces hygroscopicus]|uniref:Rieske (2Fe-2S) protein n=1 Tax=Streptomyces hygroscopicus TaxID=1912 RepID=UPI003631ED25